MCYNKGEYQGKAEAVVNDLMVLVVPCKKLEYYTELSKMTFDALTCQRAKELKRIGGFSVIRTEFGNGKLEIICLFFW